MSYAFSTMDISQGEGLTKWDNVLFNFHIVC